MGVLMVTAATSHQWRRSGGDIDTDTAGAGQGRFCSQQRQAIGNKLLLNDITAPHISRETLQNKNKPQEGMIMITRRKDTDGLRKL